MTAISRRMMSSRRPVQTPLTPLIDQIIAAGVASTDVYGFSFRKLKSSAIKAHIIRRSSDGGTTDIGFTSYGDFDIAAAATYCLGTTGTVQGPYDQSGNGCDWLATSTGNQLQLITGNNMWMVGNKPRPAMKVVAQSNGYNATLPTSITNATVSCFLVASMSNQTTTALPRFVTLLDGTTNGDTTATARALLIGRNGSSTPTNNWIIDRNSVITANPGTYDQLDQIVTIFNGTTGAIYLNNGTPVTVASTANFNVTRLTIGNGGSSFVMAPGSYISEMIFLRVAASSTVRDLIHTDQAAYYGTA